MNRLNVFLQGEGIKDVVRLEIESAGAVGDLKRVCETRGIPVPSDAAVFAEDRDEPVVDSVRISTLATKDGARLHIHRCRRVAVRVVYSGRVIEHGFGPSRTVGAIKGWATHEFGISKADAAELILQITGTHDQPDADLHIGALVVDKACAVSFDLVPNPRIQGGC